MDSQHRHELQENELANWLQEVVERVKPYSSLIVIGLVGLVLIYSAWGFYQNTSSADAASQWDLYTTAMLERSPDLGALETASEELETGAVANWADITLADGKLYEATQMWLTDRSKATERLSQAQDQYDRLLLAKGIEKTIRNRAQFGLARSYELEGEAEKAIQNYKLVSGAFSEIAAKRAKELEEPQVQSTLAWLAIAQAPAFRSPIGPGVPGEQPDFSPDSFDDLLETAPEEAATSDETLDDILKGYEKKAEEEVQLEAEEEPEKGEASAEGEATDPPAEPGASAE